MMSATHADSPLHMLRRRRGLTLGVLADRAGLTINASPGNAIIEDSPSYGAIDAELAERAGNQKVNGSEFVSTGTEPAGCDPLDALSNEYGAEWKVWKPGRYVADHRRIDVTLKYVERLHAERQLPRYFPRHGRSCCSRSCTGGA
jgi:hypothetical protein